jgi:menaquinone-dependent protoporphyrinogen oxidase
VRLFAGAVAYTECDLPTRPLFTHVSAVTAGDTGTWRDCEYTDWDAVETFAREFAACVEAESEAKPAGRSLSRVAVGLAVLAAALGVAF